MAFNHPNQLITRVYEENHAKLTNYIARMINNSEDVADLTQDVFMKLLSYGDNLRESTVTSLMFKIAVNLVNDYLRRLYMKGEIYSQLKATGDVAVRDTENEIYARDVMRIEQDKLRRMPEQRRVIYMLRIHEDKTAQEVADYLKISRRTVENHIYVGVKEMREYMRACV